MQNLPHLYFREFLAEGDAIPQTIGLDFCLFAFNKSEAQMGTPTYGGLRGPWWLRPGLLTRAHLI